MTASWKAFASILSPVGFGFGCSYIARYEEQGVGIQWHNFHRSPMVDDKYNMLSCILMMLCDALVYWILTWYIEAVFPGQYGMPKPWYFPVLKSYWCGIEQDYDRRPQNYQMNIQRQGNDNFESEPKDLQLGVSIVNMTKTYKSGSRPAVNNLNINFYQEQITSFLGHNGAGKTTTMSVLTGLFPPTEGSATVYGYDIRRNIEEIRKILGICPQHNVLFDKLTVDEHLWFYSRLKGVTPTPAEMDKMVSDVGLPHKRNSPASSLSGGMKRKLSIAMAFAANSKVVILDEPTAGVDPYARRSIWELLLKYKKGRTILLSTHFMDEADLLGDRIAIIAQGVLRCCGSSLFLKSQFGSGYHLTLVKAVSAKEKFPHKQLSEAVEEKNSEAASVVDEGVADMEDSGSSVASSSLETKSCLLDGASNISQSFVSDQLEETVTTFLQNYIPGIQLEENISTELTYQIPSEAVETLSFEEMFNAIDKNLGDLKLSSYGVSDTALEEVFLKVAEESEKMLEEEDTRQRIEDITDGK